MQVLTIESETFKAMQSMFEQVTELAQAQAKQIEGLRSNLLTVEEVAEIVGLSTHTIYRRRQEIGYAAIGSDIRFKPEDVKAWVDKYYIKAKRK